MDQTTLSIYDRRARRFAEQYEALSSARLLTMALRHLIPGAATADIGCGSGRDAAWLAQQGFPVRGYDASEGMLREARRLHPQLTFAKATLPDLEEIGGDRFVNVLCCAVLMHLSQEAAKVAVQSLLGIITPGGRLVLSVRQSQAEGEREPDGRLYTPLSSHDLEGAATAAGGRIIELANQMDEKRPQISWTIMTLERR